jgi:hypothetical protein
MFSNQRLKGEPAKAFAAFCIFRDLGPRRSLREYIANKGGRHWPRWSAQWNWVERASQFDSECDALRCQAEADSRCELEQERGRRKKENDKILWDNSLDMQTVLKKGLTAPITDVTQTKREVVDGKVITTITKVKGLNLSGYARLHQQRNENASQAIGVPEKPEEVDARKVERVVLKTKRP